MQFIILFIGVMVYVFYLFNQAPVFHNRVLQDRAMETEQRVALDKLNLAYNDVYAEKRKAMDQLVGAVHAGDEAQIDQAGDAVRTLEGKEKLLRDTVKQTIKKAIPNAKENDTDYIFLNFVLSHLPHGIIGLLLAVMFSAAMSSMAGELNALASTSVVDIYKRGIKRDASPEHYVKASQWMTFG
jgi:SSS family solute:Na+ symporter